MRARLPRLPRSLALTAGLTSSLVLTTPPPAGASDNRPVGRQAASVEAYSFVSAPHLHPPKLEALERRPGLSSGDFLLTSTGGRNSKGPQPGPLIVDSRLRPVWFRDLGAGLLAFQQEIYQGHPVLVWVAAGPLRRGRPPRPGPVGPQPPKEIPSRVVVVGEHYHRIATIQARPPWTIDPHDVAIMGKNVWVPVDRMVHQDLTSYGGIRNATVLDVGVQEYQLSTRRLIYTWDPLNPRGKPRVPLSASDERSAPFWDAYHLNSVQPLPGGDVLVSMRNTSAVYLIDPATNRIVWTLGGKHSSFRFGPGARFAWQHDARLLSPAQGGRGSDVELSLFNDNTERGDAEGMILRLNTIAGRASLVAAYPHRPPFVADFEGSMQVLPNGNALVGWGSPYAYFTEFSKSGRQLLNVRCPFGDVSYRTVLTNQWVGTPYYPPSGAVRGRTVYASWNGATEVASWEVLAGSGAGRRHVVATHRSTGFETAIPLNRAYRRYAVRALDSTGRALGTSKSFG